MFSLFKMKITIKSQTNEGKAFYRTKVGLDEIEIKQIIDTLLKVKEVICQSCNQLGCEGNNDITKPNVKVGFRVNGNNCACDCTAYEKKVNNKQKKLSL